MAAEEDRPGKGLRLADCLGRHPTLTLRGQELRDRPRAAQRSCRLRGPACIGLLPKLSPPGASVLRLNEAGPRPDT